MRSFVYQYIVQILMSYEDESVVKLLRGKGSKFAKKISKEMVSKISYDSLIKKTDKTSQSACA